MGGSACSARTGACIRSRATCSRTRTNARRWTRAIASSPTSPRTGSSRAARGSRPCTFGGPGPSSGLCATGGERTLLYGLLGPQAASVTYESGRGTKVARTSGPEGAYLIVLRSEPDTYPSGYPSRYPTDGRIVAITFRDGRTCSGERAQGRHRRGPMSAARAPAARASGGDETAARRAGAATARQGRKYWAMTVRFRARVAVTDATSAYNVRLFSPGGSGRSATAIVNRNIKAGEMVTQRFEHLHGGGTYRILVSYHRATDPGRTPMGFGGVTVGRSRLRVP